MIRQIHPCPRCGTPHDMRTVMGWCEVCHGWTGSGSGRAVEAAHASSPVVSEGADLLRKLREEVATIIREQPLYPDTHTGMRQQWVKTEILRKILALDWRQSKH